MKLITLSHFLYQKNYLFLGLFLSVIIMHPVPLKRPSKESLAKLNNSNQTSSPLKQSLSVSNALEKLEEATKTSENPFDSANSN